MVAKYTEARASDIRILATKYQQVRYESSLARALGTRHGDACHAGAHTHPESPSHRSAQGLSAVGQPVRLSI